uniref:Uncharacterized protein n=1 Tax=Knipowitschia caucasica TaxID=637954 RepID=A0AAV2L4J4_KNICA
MAAAACGVGLALMSCQAQRVVFLWIVVLITAIGADSSGSDPASFVLDFCVPKAPKPRAVSADSCGLLRVLPSGCSPQGAPLRVLPSGCSPQSLW